MFTKNYKMSVRPEDPILPLDYPTKNMYVTYFFQVTTRETIAIDLLSAYVMPVLNNEL